MIEPFIDVATLESRLSEVKLADVRWYLDGSSGRAAYDGGHIPGAVFVDLDTDLALQDDPAVGGRHPLPAPEAFAAAMAGHGIGDADTVIAYDDAGGVIAARLVWMLRVTGHEAALLDGGIQAWPGALSTSAVELPAAVFTARPWPSERLATIDDAARDEGVVIDARPRDRYAGAPDAVDPRFGHIPGAHSVPCRENLLDGQLAPAAQLRETFAAAGIVDGAEVISYCGAGVTACHNLLALEQAGFAPGRLFPGSWSQWSRDPARPVQTGEGRA
jgi:thiosulfate/3-mercaptopyruvate sulfurtransferase